MATERFDIVVTARGTRQTQRNIRRIGTEAASARRALAFMRAALVVTASARVAANFAQQLDLFTELGNRIRLVTNNARELGLVQDALFAISQRTRAEYESTTIVFQRLAQTTGNLNLEYNELLDLTATVNTAVALSGASAQSAAAGLRQFAQAMASGVLQGDELRSVVENLPALADLIGKQFGVAGAGLLALNKQTPGIIKTTEVIKALRSESGELAQTLAEAPRTLGQAFTILGNSFTFFTGKLSRATGAGRALSDAVVLLADNIDRVILGLAALTGVVVFNLLVAQVAALTNTFLRLLSVILRIAFVLGRATIVGGVLAGFALLAQTLDFVRIELQDIIDIFNLVASAGVASVNTIINAWRLFPDALRDLAFQAVNGLVDIIESGLNRAIEVLNALPYVALGPVDLPDAFNIYAGSAKRIGDIFTEEFKRIRELDPFEYSKERVQELQTFLEGFTSRGINEEAIRAQLEGLVPKAGTGGAAEQVEKLKGAYKSLLNSISPLARAYFDLQTAQELLNKAQEAGIDLASQFGLTQEEVIRRVQRDLAGVGNAATDAADNIKLVEQALESGAITAEEASRRIRQINIEALEEQTSLLAGVERGLLRVQDTALDVATGIEDTLVNAFSAAEDAFVDFVETGKFSFKSLTDSIIADLARLVFRQSVTAPLAGLLTSALGSAFGSAAGGGSGGVPDSVFDIFHNGGRVGDVTPQRRLAIPLNNLPRFHNGLASDEFPAILQRGETVIPRGQSSAPASGVVVNVYESENSRATVSESRTPGGDRQIDVFIEDIVVNSIRNPDGRVRRSIRNTFGANPSLVNR